MWPFRSKLEVQPAAGPRPVPAPVIRRDWAGLAPIQRIIGTHPLTAPPDRFSDDLATHHDPSVSSDTMGHQVSADAPAGLVLALARPTTRSDGPVMIARPRVQRREIGAVRESGEWDGDEAAPESARPTPIPATAPAIAARTLPAVAPEPAIQRLTGLPPDAEPVSVASTPQRATPTSRLNLEPLVPGSVEQSGEPASLPAARLTLGQARRLGLGAPIAKVPDRSVQRAASDFTATPLGRSPAERSPSPAMPLLSPQPESLPAMPRATRPPDSLPALVLATPSSPPPPGTPERDPAPTIPANEAPEVAAMPTLTPKPAAVEMVQPSLPLLRSLPSLPSLPSVRPAATADPSSGTSPVLPLVPPIGRVPSEPALSTLSQPDRTAPVAMPVQSSEETASSTRPASATIQRVSDGESPDETLAERGSILRDSALPGREASPRIMA